MTDKRTIQIVAFALALVVVGAIVSSTITALADKTLPDLVGDLAKVSIGALGSLLASTRSSDQPAPVTVVNEPNDAVPVEAMKAAPVKKAAKKR